MDPFDGTCKISFTKGTAFSFKGTTKHSVIKWYFKLEFMVRKINYIKQYIDTPSSRCVCYRTANDGIYEDPWIRTTYFTPTSEVIDRCNSYIISISPHFRLTLKKAIDCLKEQRIPYDYSRQNLRVQEELDCGVTMSYSFFCINYKEGISFVVVMFLVNAIINQHQFLNKFFDILMMQTREVNVTALKHICSYKHPVFAAYRILKIVQPWLLKNHKLCKSSKGSDDSAEVRKLAINSTKAYCLLPEDIIDFFTVNMVNENLGVICNAHVIRADQSEYSALDEKCLELVELAAAAVDFTKTGKLVMMPQVLKPKMYPDFVGKSESQLYKSNKILGKFYRKIKDASEEVPASSELICATEDIPNDADFETPGSADFLEDAWNHNCTYDKQLNALLGQYKVNKEEEVVTGHIWSMPKHNSRNQGELKERLKHAYSALKREFKQFFENVSRFPGTCG
ncbi:RNA-dependent RNA polymerase 6-like [Telopea speciosissima]|uniref:RNA-dependent RNA polymerase 6-like n=1 Tax=Telopea speciosissima TaxID=54955 RepID=UPI001CC7AB0E|nr:RNA-dependent RNA polymerase 6-like [Telopea speciosissima]